MNGVALITGASAGLGRGLALRLAADGYGVGLAARREERLVELAREIEAAGGRAAVLPCDVGRRDAVLDAVARCRAELGEVDLLVANAGVSENTFPDRLEAERVERVIRINFLGAVYAVEAVLPGMLERDRGHLVGVTSLAGYGGLPLTAAYSASKGALHNFLESLRIDLRATGVDVTVIAPGYVRTAMTEGNEHPMPFLMDLDDAVERMHRAIRLRKRAVRFPWPLATLVWLAQVFPAGLYDWIGSRVGREKGGEVARGTGSGTGPRSEAAGRGPADPGEPG